MARIRSIKPEYWTSETIAALPIRTRLTFIGLWSYVDDNGVGIDNFKLIASSLYGLEDDPREARDNTRACLARLANAGLIVRYSASGRRYLRVAAWDEHQRIDRPNKPRYPLPSDPESDLLTAAEAQAMDDPATAAVDDSCDPRATLAHVQRQEQGAGSRDQGIREQGTDIRPLALVPTLDAATPDADSVADAPVRATKPTRTKQQTEEAFARFWSVYPRREAKQAALKAWAKLAKDPAVDLEAVIAGAERFRDDGARQRAELRFTAHPASWLNGHRWIDERPANGTTVAAAAGLQERDGLMLGPANLAARDRRDRMAALQAQRDAQQLPAIEGSTR